MNVCPSHVLLLTEDIQEEPLGALSVDEVAAYAAVQAAQAPVHVAQGDDAAVALCKCSDAAAAGFVLPRVLNWFGPVFNVASHPHRGFFHWRCFTHQEGWFTDEDWI